MLDTKNTTYKQRKQIAVDYVPTLLEKIDNDKTFMEYFMMNKKKDDLSDCLLQGWSYLNI